MSLSHEHVSIHLNSCQSQLLWCYSIQMNETLELSAMSWSWSVCVCVWIWIHRLVLLGHVTTEESQVRECFSSLTSIRPRPGNPGLCPSSMCLYRSPPYRSPDIANPFQWSLGCFWWLSLIAVLSLQGVHRREWHPTLTGSVLGIPVHWSEVSVSDTLVSLESLYINTFMGQVTLKSSLSPLKGRCSLVKWSTW